MDGEEEERERENRVSFYGTIPTLIVDVGGRRVGKWGVPDTRPCHLFAKPPVWFTRPVIRCLPPPTGICTFSGHSSTVNASGIQSSDATSGPASFRPFVLSTPRRLR